MFYEIYRHRGVALQQLILIYAVVRLEFPTTLLFLASNCVSLSVVQRDVLLGLIDIFVCEKFRIRNTETVVQIEELL